ncbi:MAG TPA: ribosome-associated translation inhibitor RaiA [Candidatus Saccharibacteria bacterium]|jgi:putative sigma-54 modulation protein|nr:ribosome-associated translation inhibitor RaiA [Candidatus Saccharibacteria bacterium]HMT55530.1 ribosome-associated translation inhibitor RaiA [Candidatus Saccharibacteria bacterium]
MIENIAITGMKTDVTHELERYITKKIGKLDKRLKRSQRSEVRADVKLNESTSVKNGKRCTCEVILHIPGARLTAVESTINMFAAVDIVETKLQNQLKKHKEKHSQSQDKHENSKARRAIGKFFSR